jgi:hypothetical protein
MQIICVSNFLELAVFLFELHEASSPYRLQYYHTAFTKNVGHVASVKFVAKSATVEQTFQRRVRSFETPACSGVGVTMQASCEIQAMRLRSMLGAFLSGPITLPHVLTCMCRASRT